MSAVGKTLSGGSIDSLIKEDVLKVNMIEEGRLNIW